jgi:hypothetical protein
MTAPEWSIDQLGALADEWLAEREMFLSRMQAYLTTQLPRVVPDQQQTLSAAAYEAELTSLSARLNHFLQIMDSTVWYTLQRRLADFQRQLDDEFGAAVRADAQRLAALRPPAALAPVHHAMQQALGLMQYILDVYKDMHGLFDFPTLRLTWRLVSQMKYLLYPARLALPALQRYWLLDEIEIAACEPPASAIAPDSGIQHHPIDRYRGAYTSYVPEYYQAERPWPLIIAMHGASGNAEDFLWTWLIASTRVGCCSLAYLTAAHFATTWALPSRNVLPVWQSWLASCGPIRDIPMPAVCRCTLPMASGISSSRCSLSVWLPVNCRSGDTALPIMNYPALAMPILLVKTPPYSTGSPRCLR